MSDFVLRMETMWRALMDDIGIPEQFALPVFSDLCRRYAEPHRAYHTLGHIHAVLEALGHVHNSEGLRLAAWFHDAVYDTRALDNEAQSAALASDTLTRWGVSETLRTQVETLILATATHTAEGGSDVALFLDADLAILGAEPEVFAGYSSAIRREFGWVLDDAYRTGRGRVLSHFLERPRIYQTQAFYERLEDHARQNLSREIEELHN